MVPELTHGKNTNLNVMTVVTVKMFTLISIVFSFYTGNIYIFI